MPGAAGEGVGDLGSRAASGAGSGKAAAAALLGRVAEGGARFETVVFTRNQRVMASVANGGRTLRVHESFVEAPPAVLAALGALFSAGSEAARARARAVVRDFLRSVEPAPAPRPRRRRRDDPPDPLDAAYIEALLVEFCRINDAFFDSRLPEVPIRISGRMRRRNGHFSVDPLEIAISRLLLREALPGEAEQTLRHEMIHLWQWRAGVPIGHGREFREWARRLGIPPRATREVCWSEASR